jgi:hypothetical protein
MAATPKIDPKSMTELMVAFDSYMKSRGAGELYLKKRIGGVFDTLDKVVKTLTTNVKKMDFGKMGEQIQKLPEKLESAFLPMSALFKTYTDKFKKTFDRLITQMNMPNNLSDIFGIDLDTSVLTRTRNKPDTDPKHQIKIFSLTNNIFKKLKEMHIVQMGTKNILAENLNALRIAPNNVQTPTNKPEEGLSQKGITVDHLGSDVQKYFDKFFEQKEKPNENGKPRRPRGENSEDDSKGGILGFLGSLLGIALGGAGILALISAVMGPNSEMGMMKFFGKLFIVLGKSVKEIFSGLLGKAVKLIKSSFHGIVEFFKGGVIKNTVTGIKGLGRGILNFFKGGMGLGKMFSAAKGGMKVLKRIPVIGLLLGIGFAIKRYKDGDYVGSILEMLSGIASLFPGIGTGVSLVIDALTMFYDMETGGSEEAGKLTMSQQGGKLGDVIWNGVKKLFEALGNVFTWLWDFLKEKFTAAGDWLKDKTIDYLGDKASWFFGEEEVQDHKSRAAKRDKLENIDNLKPEEKKQAQQKFQIDEALNHIIDKNTLLNQYGARAALERKSYDENGKLKNFITGNQSDVVAKNLQEIQDKLSSMVRANIVSGNEKMLDALATNNPTVFKEKMNEIVSKHQTEFSKLFRDFQNNPYSAEAEAKLKKLQSDIKEEISKTVASNISQEKYNETLLAIKKELEIANAQRSVQTNVVGQVGAAQVAATSANRPQPTQNVTSPTPAYAYRNQFFPATGY